MNKKKPNTLGRNLRIARVIKNLSQSELAERTNLDQSYISRIETGYEPSEGALGAITYVLGISIEELRNSPPEELTKNLLLPREKPKEPEFDMEEKKEMEEAQIFLTSGLKLSETVKKLKNKMEDTKRSSTALEFLCRHLVALYVTYQKCNESGPIGEPQFFACPGTIICVRGVSAFLTAGHTLKDWDESLKQGKIRVIRAALADTFGSERVTNEPIPFDFINEPQFYIDDKDEGLDFGLIFLRPYYIRLLARNGVKVVSEENWVHQHRIEFDAYAMLGLPDEFTKSRIENLHGEVRVQGMVSPTLISLKRLEQVPPGRATRLPRFVGQLDPGLQIGSIKGMSGGPILGFRFGPPMEYWIVAIQSSWLPHERITFGCSVPVLAERITAWIDQLSERHGASIPENGTANDGKVES